MPKGTLLEEPPLAQIRSTLRSWERRIQARAAGGVERPLAVFPPHYVALRIQSHSLEGLPPIPTQSQGAFVPPHHKDVLAQVSPLHEVCALRERATPGTQWAPRSLQVGSAGNGASEAA